MHFKNVHASAEVTGSLRGDACDRLPQGSSVPFNLQDSGGMNAPLSPLSMAAFVRDGCPLTDHYMKSDLEKMRVTNNLSPSAAVSVNCGNGVFPAQESNELSAGRVFCLS